MKKPKKWVCPGWKGPTCGKAVMPDRMWCEEHDKQRIEHISRQLEIIRKALAEGEEAV